MSHRRSTNPAAVAVPGLEARWRLPGLEARGLATSYRGGTRARSPAGIALSCHVGATGQLGEQLSPRRSGSPAAVAVPGLEARWRLPGLEARGLATSYRGGTRARSPAGIALSCHVGATGQLGEQLSPRRSGSPARSGEEKVDPAVMSYGLCFLVYILPCVCMLLLIRFSCLGLPFSVCTLCSISLRDTDCTCL